MSGQIVEVVEGVEGVQVVQIVEIVEIVEVVEGGNANIEQSTLNAEHRTGDSGEL